MLRNIELIKTQLAELASVINLYKSEAVQLKIVELVFKHGTAGDSSDIVEDKESPVKRRGKRTQKPVKTNRTGQKRQRTAAGRKTSSKRGPAPALQRLLDTGFFKAKRKMADIVTQCRTKLASPLKNTALSGPLARFVHDGKLDRDTNKDGQYEYIQK